ncbi:MAG: tetratricopeptide repeat protein [Leptospiraceae bacterium]|nr:tetratricopeptide repeat protein [Leptospiraceae bacterium]
MKDAKKAYSQKQFQKAIKLFQEHIEEHPNNGEAYMYLGYIYESLKNFPKSILMFRKAADLNISTKYKQIIYLKIALYYNYHQDWELAGIYANRLLKVNPKSKDGQKIRDRAELNRGNSSTNSNTVSPDVSNLKKHSNDPEKAIYFLEKAINENRAGEDVRWELALLYMKTENYSKADATLQWLISKKPKNKNYLYKAGIAKIRLGSYQEAIDLFEESIANSTEKDTKLLFYNNLNEGVAYHKLKNLATAAKFYRKALALENSIVPVIALTRIKYDAGDWENCIKTADTVLEKSTEEPESMMFKGLSQLKLKQKKQGMANLLKFRKFLLKKEGTLDDIPEKYHDGIIKLARFYTNRKKYKLARKYFKSVENTKENTKEYLFYLGKNYLYSKEPENAVRLLQKLDFSSAYYLMAKSFALHHNLNLTKESLKRAGAKKEIYWKKAKNETYFQEFKKDPEFVKFIDNKGVVSSPQIPPSKKEENPQNSKSNPQPLPKININK